MEASTATFVIPATEHLSYTNADGKIESLLDITPAPWPFEAVWIFRFVLIGIPVNVSLHGMSPPVSFVISGANREGHLVVISKTNSDAVSLLRAFELQERKAR
jgi:hypothetical protein